MFFVIRIRDKIIVGDSQEPTSVLEKYRRIYNDDEWEIIYTKENGNREIYNRVLNRIGLDNFVNGICDYSEERIARIIEIGEEFVQKERKTKRFSITIPVEQYHFLTQKARKNTITVSRVCERIIQAYRDIIVDTDEMNAEEIVLKRR